MSWGAEAIQAAGQNSGGGGGGGSSFAANTSNAMGHKASSLSDVYAAAQEDMRRNEANRVALPQNQPPQLMQLPQIGGMNRQQQGAQQFQQPPVINGFNL